MKLSQKQLDALQESIYHWYENLYLALAGMGGEIDTSATGCACCQTYMSGWDKCGGCPLVIVGQGCNNPEISAVWSAESRLSRPQALVLAICAEIHYLESLDTEA